MKRTWAGEVRNVSLLMASAVNSEGYREILGICEGAKERLGDILHPPNRNPRQIHLDRIGKTRYAAARQASGCKIPGRHQQRGSPRECQEPVAKRTGCVFFLGRRREELFDKDAINTGG
jgi:hypothetical protein